MVEDLSAFESRKVDHIRASLEGESQPNGTNGFDRIELIHNALPGLNFAKINTRRQFLGREVSPLFISSMTAGHKEGQEINTRLAKACQAHSWIFGVGSQRRQLMDKAAFKEWEGVRKAAPECLFLGNLGISQLKEVSQSDLMGLIESIGAQGLFIHTNPLQEALQKEGTRDFSGELDALAKLCSYSPVPIILKETGCGFSEDTLKKLKTVGLFAVDISGFGGTHWGRVEGLRAAKNDFLSEAAKTFSEWGISTLDSILNFQKSDLDCELWASGGMRTGLDAAKALAMGASFVGFARPMMQAVLQSEEILHEKMQLLEYELRVALFCTGQADLKSLNKNKPYKLKQSRNIL